ncbi:MAG: hypothetical protein V4510_01130 [bacterium]
MKILAALALLVAVTFAGCSSTKTDDTPACPDIHAVTNSTVFPAGCPMPVAPSIHLGASSYTVAVFGSLPITWSIANGTHSGGHAMIAIAKLSHHSVPTAELAGPGTYGVKDLAGGEVHQNLPQSFNYTSPAGAFTKDLIGTRYMRIYAQIRADDLPLRDYWSDEVTVTVTPVQPTNVVRTIIHGAGGFQGGLTPPSPVSANLGDTLVFENDDAMAHTFTLVSHPSCAPLVNPVALAAGVPSHTSGPSPGIFLDCPGDYKFDSDDQPTKLSTTITVNL